MGDPALPTDYAENRVMMCIHRDVMMTIMACGRWMVRLHRFRLQMRGEHGSVVAGGCDLHSRRSCLNIQADTVVLYGG